VEETRVKLANATAYTLVNYNRLQCTPLIW